MNYIQGLRSSPLRSMVGGENTASARHFLPRPQLFLILRHFTVQSQTPESNDLWACQWQSDSIKRWAGGGRRGGRSGGDIATWLASSIIGRERKKGSVRLAILGDGWPWFGACYTPPPPPNWHWLLWQAQPAALDVGRHQCLANVFSKFFLSLGNGEIVHWKIQLQLTWSR